MMNKKSRMIESSRVCIGDFNEITHQEEKTGDARRREGHMAAFLSVLEECHPGDLGFIGPRYTWSNKRAGGVTTQVRLDRTLANRTWCERHGGAEVFVLAARASDHNPLLLQIEKEPLQGVMEHGSSSLKIGGGWTRIVGILYKMHGKGWRRKGEACRTCDDVWSSAKFGLEDGANKNTEI